MDEWTDKEWMRDGWMNGRMMDETWKMDGWMDG